VEIDTILLFVVLALVASVLVMQIVCRPNREGQEIVRKLAFQLEQLQSGQLRSEESLRTQFAQSRQEAGTQALESRTETSTRLDGLKGESSTAASLLRQETRDSLKTSNDSMLITLNSLSSHQGERLQIFSERLEKLSVSNEIKLDQVRNIVESKLSELRDDNGKRLEEMRLTVDERLQGTLEKRLGESFKQVSERLELVHSGLGEMKNLAVGVGDLKKVLTNVKTRGGWSEVQLGALLEQMLAPAQYQRNVHTKTEASGSVEYAIKLPGQGEGADSVVWLPVDSKFPAEDYKRLVEAQENGDIVLVESSIKALRQCVIQSAKDISSKYINVPTTTDFAIMFVPTEGLFAEIIRQPGIIEELQSTYHVVVAGPTTFWALLNSLRMGFRTLTIQKQASDVWKTLGLVKSEFARFGESIDAVKKNLQQASNKMDDVGKCSRAVERQLRVVEELPSSSKEIEIPDLVSVV
jgi:DNA recombination protein RmuC